MSKHLYSTSNLTDKELKDQGNRWFLAHKYDEAIICYTKAIIKNPNMPTYYTNRALCYLKVKRFESACQDCRRAIDIDPGWVKGHFFLGQALVQLEVFDEAILHLQRAHDLGKSQKLNFGDDIASQLRTARKRRWSLIEEKRMAEEIELQTYLNSLIVKDAEAKIQNLRAQNLSEAELTVKRNDCEQICEHYRSELNAVFAKIDERRQKREVPDYLCGRISFEILDDPVVTPSGITYERKDIEEHLQRVGHFDPVTRHMLTQDMLIPNYAMKEVVDGFMKDNEWANDY